MKLKPSEVFGKNGLAASALHSYEHRAEQERMMAAVQKAIRQDEVIIVEAGTGVGKTLAYLVPAVASGRQAVVATGTRTLMEQLVNKDLPILSEILREPVDVAVLKGRSNYICLQRLSGALDSPDLFLMDDIKKLRKIRRWSDESATGDVAGMTGVAEDDPVLKSVVCQVETCTGRICPFFSSCFLFRARARALEADLVITNHHLLMADMAMSAESDLDDDQTGPLLPSDAVLIIDEAHGLEDVATTAFGLHTSRNSVSEIARDAVVFAGQCDPAASRVVTNVCRRVEDQFGRLVSEVSGRRERARISSGPDDAAVSREAARIWHELDSDLETIATEVNHMAAGTDRQTDVATRVAEVRGVLSEVLDNDDLSMVRIVEKKGQGGSFSALPVDVSGLLSERLFLKGRPVVLTSATMSVGGSTGFFRSRLGIPDGALECVLKSPYDYASRVLLYTPDGMASPSDELWAGQVISEMAGLIDLVKGRTLALFTSRAALNRAASELPELVKYPIFVQGTMQRAELVRRFKDAGNAVLLATAAFREGLDIAGDALSCVIMDRLPFEPPDEPLLMARSDRVRQAGKSPFLDYQVPLAVIRLRQGFGRLIRRRTDRGIVAVLDPRINKKNYGKVFIGSLPPASRALNFDEVKKWSKANLFLSSGQDRSV